MDEETGLAPEMVLTLYFSQGLSTYEIARRHKVTARKIKWIIKKAGYKLRTKSEAIKNYWARLEDHSIRHFKKTPEQIEKTATKIRKKWRDPIWKREMLETLARTCPQHVSDETREKISKARIGKHSSIKTRQKMSEAHKGKSISEAARHKMSETQKEFYSLKEHRDEQSKRIKKICEDPEMIEKKRIIGKNLWEDLEYRDKHSGENHWNWKGGISYEPYPIKFNNQLKRQIFLRDDHKCRYPRCDKKPKRLVIHHIDYIKENSDPVNLVVLCNVHNSKVNYNREYWANFFQAYQKTRQIRG